MFRNRFKPLGAASGPPRNGASHPTVAFLVRSLERTGGAEQQLVHLAIGLHTRGWAVRVLTFYSADGLGGDLAAAGVPVVSLKKSGRWDLIGFGRRLVRELSLDPPAILQSMLTPPNVVAALLANVGRRRRIVWGIRASNMNPARYDWTHRLGAWAEARLATRADLVIANSAAGRAESERRGFPGAHLCVIPNGIDTDRFRGDRPDRGAALRQRWLAGSPGPLIGLVARIDPMKDHHTFLEAAHRLQAEVPLARFVCVGARNTPSWPAVRNRCTALGLDRAVHWEDPRADMPEVYNALDLLTLTSAFGEGFPNVVGEAMASCTPVVATNVGDCATLLGDTGRVVPPQDAGRLAAAWKSVLDLDADARTRLTRAARARIIAHYSVDAMVDATAARYRQLVALA